MSCHAFNCTYVANRPLDPNPDISGIGVLTGFLVTAWATFLAIIVHYVTSSADTSLNPLDASLRSSTQCGRKWNLNARWDKPMRTIILAMSDQQLVTGFAILVGAYTQLTCGISLYHWQIVTTLAWFSSVSHLATLPFLRDFIEKHKYLLFVRATFMAALAILLAIALVLHGKKTSDVKFTPATPAKCAFDLPNEGFDAFGVGFYIVLSELLLLGPLISRLLQLIPIVPKVSVKILGSVRTGWQDSIIWFCGKFENSRQWIRMVTVLPPVFSLALLISVQALYDLFRSGAFDVLWLLFALIWGTIRLFAVRYSLDNSDSILEEGYWGFGQFVPVLLLLIPICQAAQSWSEAGHESPIVSSHQSHAQLISLPHGSRNSSPAQSQISLHDYSPVPSTTSLPTSASHTIYGQIITLCKHDFRAEPWYQGNLHFLLSCLISASPIVLPGALFTDLDFLGMDIFLRGCLILGGSCFAIMVMPLCGLMDSLLPPHYSLSQRHPLSIIRIAIDNGKAYKWFRRGCYFCLPFIFISPYPWFLFYVVPFFPTLGVAAYEVISRV